MRDGGLGMVGLHAAFTCSDETIAAAAELAASHGVGVHVHVAEGPVDVGAADRLRPHATDDWLLVHGVHLADDHGLAGTIVHNPRSNMNNAVGYARPTRFDQPCRPRHRRHRRRHARRVPSRLRQAARGRRHCWSRRTVGVARAGLDADARGSRRHGDVVVRPDRSVAARVHHRASARWRSRSRANSCGVTERRLVSTPPRSAPRAAEQATRLFKTMEEIR
ncbi:MAG: amidohydrolase family protein [Ilumatobacteraceae bacterium]